MSTSERNAETYCSSRENNIRQLEEHSKVSIDCRADTSITEWYSQAAGERYSNKVVSHADSIKSIEKLKRQLTTAQSAQSRRLSAITWNMSSRSNCGAKQHRHNVTVVETFTIVVVVVGVVVVVSEERHVIVMVMGWWLFWKL